MMMIIVAVVKTIVRAAAINKWYLNWDICCSLLLFSRFYTSLLKTLCDFMDYMVNYYLYWIGWSL